MRSIESSRLDTVCLYVFELQVTPYFADGVLQTPALRLPGK